MFRTAFFRTLSVLGLALAAIPNAQAVIIDGKDWRQVTETTNLSYNNMAAACDVGTGLCQGLAVRDNNTSVDVDGWTWASAADIASLFEVVTGAPAGTFDVEAINFSQSYADASWALDFIDVDGSGADPGLFDLTLNFNVADHAVFGITRTLLSDGRVDRSYIRDGTNNAAIVGNPLFLDTARTHTGIWLYKTVDVPSPATWLILAGALAMLRLRRCS